MSDTTTLTPVQDIKNNLLRMTPEFAKLLPSHVSPDKFVNIAITAIMNMPSLIDADRRSLYNACVQAATDGLVPDSREGVIIPFKGKAKWMPMIAGICKKVRNSGEIGDIDAQVVHEHDDYKAWVDEKGRHFRFEKAKGDRGNPILTFAYAVGRDGSFYFEEITEEEMTKIEAMARATDSPWKGPFKNEMRRKSAMRRLAKYRLPQSSDLQGLTQTEDDIYDNKSEHAKPENGQPNRLKSAMGIPSDPPAATDAEISFPDRQSEVPI